MAGCRTRIALLLVLVLALVSGGAVAGAAAAPTAARTLTAANALETQVLAELNGIRRRHGLAPLRISQPLTTAANAHTRAMGTYGFFAHDSRDGTEFWQRVKRFYGPSGYESWSVGENLLWASTDLGAAAAVKLWMGSPGHRKNILTPRWREIGLSALTVDAAPGVFGGRDVVIITTDFGARS